MKLISDGAPQEGSLSGLEVVSEATYPPLDELCVGVRLYDEQVCIDPEVPRLAAELGKCVTCDTCQLKLEEQAFTDELTGLGNRRALKRRFRQLLRQNSPILMVFTDIRNLKAVNELDSYQKGDDMLVASAEKISELVRNVDEVTKARVGGDEVVVLMRLKQEREVAEGVMEAVPVSPENIPQIEAGIALRIITGHNNMAEFKAFNKQYGLKGKDKIGIRVGTAVVDPAELRRDGRTVKPGKVMKQADPKKQHFDWNDLA